MIQNSSYIPTSSTTSCFCHPPLTPTSFFCHLQNKKIHFFFLPMVFFFRLSTAELSDLWNHGENNHVGPHQLQEKNIYLGKRQLLSPLPSSHHGSDFYSLSDKSGDPGKKTTNFSCHYYWERGHCPKHIYNRDAVQRKEPKKFIQVCSMGFVALEKLSSDLIVYQILRRTKAYVTYTYYVLVYTYTYIYIRIFNLYSYQKYIHIKYHNIFGPSPTPQIYHLALSNAIHNPWTSTTHHRGRFLQYLPNDLGISIETGQFWFQIISK